MISAFQIACSTCSSMVLKCYGWRPSWVHIILQAVSVSVHFLACKAADGAKHMTQNIVTTWRKLLLNPTYNSTYITLDNLAEKVFCTLWTYRYFFLCFFIYGDIFDWPDVLKLGPSQQNSVWVQLEDTGRGIHSCAEREPRAALEEVLKCIQAEVV